MTSHGAPLVPFTTLSSETVLSTRIFRVDALRRRSGRFGRVFDVWRIEAPDWVNVVAVTKGGDLVLVRQERHGVEAVTLEVPGGAVDPGETPEAAALRELL